ncbi:MAG: hypothetical protein ACPG4T_19390, partial [Nannocystaceae bacterium]
QPPITHGPCLPTLRIEPVSSSPKVALSDGLKLRRRPRGVCWDRKYLVLEVADVEAECGVEENA